MSIRNSHNNVFYNLNRSNMPQEENLGDAERCIDKAEDAIARGDFDKAERLLLKAERLCSLVNVKQLLREVRAKKNAGGSTSNGRRSCVYTQSSLNDDTVEDAADECLDKAQLALDRGELDKAERWVARAQRMRASVRGEELKQRVEEAKHLRSLQPTPEQLDAIRRAFAATSDHERLGIGLQASQAEIKKAYRRLTRFLHPDKNRSPEAEEAFRTVTAAYERLLG